MKKYFLLFCIFTIALSSCRKKVDTGLFDPSVQAEADDRAIQDYFLLNGITDAVKDPSGLYYQIINPGTGPHPTTTSKITVAYTANLTDGTVVDNQPSYYFTALDGLIDAWRIGPQLIGKGGNIILYVPSALGYGNDGRGSIPANAVLIFNITLQGFNN